MNHLHLHLHHLPLLHHQRSDLSSRFPPIPRPNRPGPPTPNLHRRIPLPPSLPPPPPPNPTPRSLPRLILSSAFAREFLHFYLHRKDPSASKPYFDLMLLPVSLCAVSSLLRPDWAGGLARGVGLVMQGAWFV
ncbi:hypothetical protein Syun_029803 [Stephania yunnanensis]|uniref:Uncharacterized protein n=1 Tax=Stephania yunnanensis TaxID=152371 RepID=A0AAP0E692_9MAGN